MLGAIIGDIVGSVYEFNNIKTKDFPLFLSQSRPTDDSIMTFAIAECIQKRYVHDENKIIDTLKKWGHLYPYAGYGGRFFNWLFTDNTSPYNSCGNGSAMRISAAGWYGRNEEEVKELAYNLTAVTHNHPEGLKGAEVTAMCIYYARIGKSKDFIRSYVSKYYDINFDYEELRKTYVHGEEICQVTVPQAIYCFLISTDFLDCLRTTISIGGDCDTTAAISCAIAEAYYKDIDVFIINKAMDILKKYDINGCMLDVLNTFIEHKACALVNDENISQKTKYIGIEENNKISFIHSSNVKPLIEYINMFYLDDCKDLVVVKTMEDLKIVLKGLGEKQKFLYFDSMEEVVNYLNDNYSLNNQHSLEVITNEYYK